MNPKTHKKISKRLSLILRHNPKSVGLTLDTNGWVNVQELLSALNRNGLSIDIDAVNHIVAECPKQRFEFDESQSLIRARQGHSIDIDLGYEVTKPPTVLYHGTADRFLDSIFKDGLKKQTRHHVHLSTNTSLMMEVGRRHGKAVLLEIDAGKMREDGHEFFVTENDVWLTNHVPCRYLTLIEQ